MHTHTASSRTARAFAISCWATALLMAAPAAALADPNATVTHGSATADFVTTDICAFPIAVHQYDEGTVSVRQTANGTLFEVSAHEVDSFTANGVTLTSTPFAYHFTGAKDLQGNIVQQTAEGVMVKVPLPDGSTFFATGRADALASGVSFITYPDVGMSRGREEFCAVLGG